MLSKGLAAALLSASAAWAVVPLPAKTTPSEGGLAITAGFAIQTMACQDSRIAPAARRLEARIGRQTGIPIEPGKISGAPAVKVSCGEHSSGYPQLGEDESYTLKVSPEGARLEAKTGTGALRGLETFAQLIVPGPGGFIAPAESIEDSPRFRWRGLMLDVSRHWMPLEVVLRNLDAMAAVKLNVFHWHLSDDQGIRVESKRFPRLQQFGSDGHFYTQAEIREVVDYGRDRAIRVVPEFDLPGHSTALLAAYPELASAPGPYGIERDWGIFKPTLDPSQEATYRFLDGFLGEMAALFPDSYFHIGGDEVDETQWKQSKTIQEFARRHDLPSSERLQAYFTGRVQAIVKQHGKSIIGWDEILNADIRPDAVIQSWRGQASLAEAAHKGYRGLLSYGFYLDHMNTAAFHYANEPLSGDAAKLAPNETGRILGGEACMWTEYVSPETIDSRIWPRLGAIAERLWSPRETQDVADLYRRLDALSRTLDWVGVRHRANYQPMLERIAGTLPLDPVRMVADSVEAVGLDDRYQARHYTSEVPLNRLPDAARPESESVRRLTELAEKAIADAAARADLQAAFMAWKTESPAPGSSNPLLAELSPIRAELSESGRLGLEALDLLASGQPAPEVWLAETRKSLDRLEQPHAELRLAAVRPVRALVEALTRRGDSKIGNGSPVRP